MKILKVDWATILLSILSFLFRIILLEWCRARAFQRETWKLRDCPVDNGKGQLKPLHFIFIWEVLTDSLVNVGVNDLVLINHSLIPGGD